MIKNKKLLLTAFKKIYFIRKVEETFAEIYSQKKIFSFLHLCIGQEASAVGVAMAMSKGDVFFGNHRSHGHYLAKGGDTKKLIYECFGDLRGSVEGKGGSMHLYDKKINFLGSVVILGSGASIASGLAMAKILNNKKKKEIVVCFVGDGSAEEGCFYETINMAGLYKLPLLIVIEDNKYAVEASNEKRKVKNYNFKKTFKDGLQAEYIRANGSDVEADYKSASNLKHVILNKKKVGILHLDCYRHAKHSGANISKNDQKSKYRLKGEFSKIQKNDPLRIITERLIKKNFSMTNLDKIKNNINTKIQSIFKNTLKTIKIRQL